MLPPAGIAGAVSFLGFSAIIASVVIKRPATEAASCSAVRTTFAGSMTPPFVEVTVRVNLRVPAVCIIFGLEDLTDDDRTVRARIARDLSGRCLEGTPNNLDAGLLVVVRRREVLQGLDRAEKRNAATGKDAFLDRRTRRMQSVLTGPFLFDVDLSCITDRMTATPPVSLASRPRASPCRTRGVLDRD